MQHPLIALCLGIALVTGACASPASAPATKPATDVVAPDTLATDSLTVSDSEVGTTDTLASCSCGDAVCDAACGETLKTCSIDCAKCGDEVCSPGESPKSCKLDCCGAFLNGQFTGAGCGDGLCKGYECGENPQVCPADCGNACGNGSCDKGESPETCKADCAKQVCGNKVCEPEDGGPQLCPEDCGNACGDCVCDKGETFLDCPVDCGFCGDGVCSRCDALGETKATCAVDCLSDACKVPGGCDDGLECTLEGCNSAGECLVLTDPVQCSDGNPCTKDICAAGNECKFAPLPEGTACDDEDACTGNGSCSGSKCLKGTPLGCDDGDPCTTDTCSNPAGCTSSPAPDGTPCADDKACTANSCVAGICDSGPQVCSGNAVCKEPAGCACLADFVTLDVDGSPFCAPDFFVGPLPPDGLANFEYCNSNFGGCQPLLKDLGDGTVEDARGLLWQKADSGTVLNWTNAKGYCANLNLGAKSDWRMPTVAELQGLTDFTKTKPAVAPVFATSTQSADYWTAQPAFGVSGNFWQVGMDKGNTYHDKGTNTYRVRCVRSTKPVSVDEVRFVAASDNATVLDTRTGLVWQRAVDAGKFSNAAASDFCKTLQLAYKPAPGSPSLANQVWRLPTIGELRTLVNRQAYNPTAFDAFPGTPAEFFWSSTASAATSGSFWYVGMFNGYNNVVGASQTHRVRCVLSDALPDGGGGGPPPPTTCTGDVDCPTEMKCNGTECVPNLP